MIDLKSLEYPFDWKYLNRKKKTLKKLLINRKNSFLEKKIAILGGSTTNELKLVLELFLLKEGIKPIFYETEYNKYYEEALFGNELEKFNPDIIYIYINEKNIRYPAIINSDKEINEIYEIETGKIEEIWKTLNKKFSCIIIQNNFELPQYRLIGNSSNYLKGGRVNYINRLNDFISRKVKEYNNLYINDLNYLSALVGLEEWNDEFLWFNYKYAISFKGISYVAHSVASIIKSIFGKNKKVIALDLDNTLWGGVIGDDGINGIQIGSETAVGESYLEFQRYLKNLKDLGIILSINSKNDFKNVKEALESHPSMLLKEDDFFSIRANWDLKSKNIIEIAKEINIGEDSIVFLDDNPTERELVETQVEGVSVPNIGNKSDKYIDFIDRNNYFEILSISKEDLERKSYYEDNKNRQKQEANFTNYEDFLSSLNMVTEIEEAKEIYLDRIYQLINKTNQFNLTTKRYTKVEVEEVFKNSNKILLYGRLKDKFGDNGLISVIIGEKENEKLFIPLWIMSCRVLKREMEKAMLDKLVEIAKKMEIEILVGEYIPSPKNGMVKEHYKELGFKEIFKKENETTTWELNIKNYKNQNKLIKMGEY